ncbi:nucleotidyltransferase domain-containing protein [Lichenibacterium ramalinae]|uniref:Nucleotidyltransferase domain-containing protein n=1 Tax=Lichenibacterium ramalinae TaxID=2316527 RepID=A0A4Q2R6Q6_9HYPH|nr:nucleotidyltransferase domain-containing protein [Lichenibacterium ramalinae]RYB01383.1 nucleotidyltransferase domain-containing protein [Lichenibacterium ramalinae]
MIPSDLPALAEAVAKWADEAPGVPAVYVFGSRVRGDHHSGSDVDLCVILDEMEDGNPIDPDDWWDAQHRASFADLTAVLPGPLEMHYDLDDPALRWMREARADPSRIVLQVRKVVCLWMPPKPVQHLETTP